VADYRAYIIDHEGHINRAVELECPDDEAAEKAAKQLVNGHDVELWQRERKVATFKHMPD
jgi:hypothetical protein